MGNQMSDVFARVVSICHGHDIVNTDGSSHDHDVQIETMTTISANTDHHEEEEEEANMEMAAIAVEGAHPTGAGQEANTLLIYTFQHLANNIYILSHPVTSVLSHSAGPFSSLFSQRIEVQNSDNDVREGDDVHIVGIRDNIQTHGSAGGGGGTVQLEGNYEESAAGQQPVRRKMNSGIFLSISTATLSVASAAISRPTPKRLYSEDLLIVAYTLDLIMLLVLGILLYGLTFGLTLVPDSWVPAVRTAMTTVAGALLVLLLFLVAFVTYNLVPHYHP